MNAIITGATKGIGLAIAHKFCQNGFDLAICSRNASELESLARELEDRYESVRVHVMAADLSARDQTEAFAAFCIEKLKTPEVLVNNAGVFIPGALLEEDDTALEKMINTNLYSAYYLTRKIAPLMVQAGKGCIINISSIAGIKAYPNGGSYGISKFALRGFSKSLREELKSTGVKVTTVLPGATWSNSWEGVDLPEERLMQPEDIAAAIWSIFEMSPSAVLEELILRPQLGDL